MHAPDAEVLDMAWYKDAKLALLCQRPAEHGLPPRSSLLLADALDLQFAAVPPGCPHVLQVRLPLPSVCCERCPFCEGMHEGLGFTDELKGLEFNPKP